VVDRRRQSRSRSGRQRQGSLSTVGTFDPLLDDSMFLHARWFAAENEVELAVYPGAPHGFNSLGMPQAAAADARIDHFLKRSLHAESESVSNQSREVRFPPK
jgi:acetyl esterase/lipase